MVLFTAPFLPPSRRPGSSLLSATTAGPLLGPCVLPNDQAGLRPRAGAERAQSNQSGHRAGTPPGTLRSRNLLGEARTLPAMQTRALRPGRLTEGPCWGGGGGEVGSTQPRRRLTLTPSHTGHRTPPLRQGAGSPLMSCPPDPWIPWGVQPQAPPLPAPTGLGPCPGQSSQPRSPTPPVGRGVAGGGVTLGNTGLGQTCLSTQISHGIL